MQHLDLGFPKRGPANLIGFLLSFVTCLHIIKLLKFAASPCSPKAYCIGILLIPLSVLDSWKCLLHVLPDEYFSLIAKIILYCNWVFFLDSNPVTSLNGTRTRAMTTVCDMTAVYVVNCLCDEFKRSVDDSGRLAHAKQIVSQLNCSQNDVAQSRNPLQAWKYICPACPSYLQSPEPSIHSTIWCFHMKQWIMIYSSLRTIVWSHEQLMFATQSLTTKENLKYKMMPSGCRYQSSQMIIQSRCWLNRSTFGPRLLVLESANGQQIPWGLVRRRVDWQCIGKIINWGSPSGRLPSPNSVPSC